MSDQLSQVLTILSRRSKATRDREIQAKGIYAKFLLGPQPGADSAEGVIDAMDQLGIGIEEISRDLVETKFAGMVESLIEENGKAVAGARTAILAAKRELSTARGHASRGAVGRATAHLRERVTEAVDLEEHGEGLRRAFKVFSHRGRAALQVDIDAAAAATREAEQHNRQNSATEAFRVDGAKAVAVPAVERAARGAGVKDDSEPEPSCTEAPAISAVVASDEPAGLGAPIIPDLTPNPTLE